MKTYFKKIIFFYIILISTVYASSYEKVSFIDMEFIIKNSNAGKKIIEKINDLNNENIKKLKIKEQELKKKEESIKKKQNIISKEEYENEIIKFKVQINEFRNEKDIMVKNLNDFKEKELGILYKKMNPIIQKYMDNNKIQILLDVKNIIVGKTTSDITKDIIEEINKQIN